nr:hypothetical protein DM860_003442 [Ipomoea trifida]
MKGGGWCSTPKECKERSAGSLGTSNNLPPMEFGHIISKSNLSKGNPEFCNWNRVHVHYCDGSSFTSDIETVNSTTKVFYRGARIFNTLMDELLSKGMKQAKNGSSPMLPSSCVAKSSRASMYILQDVKTPMFVVMSSFDQVQISYNLSPNHLACLVRKNCTLAEMASIEGLRLGLIKALPIANSSFRGMWVTNCITHEITMYSWITKVLLRIDGNKTYPQVFADWFYDRSAVQIIDQCTEAKNCSYYGIEIRKKWGVR